MMPIFDFRNWLVLFALNFFIVQANAQEGLSNARSMSMAGAYTALAAGVESPIWNPANLGLRNKNAYTINLLSVGVSLNNNGFTYDQYLKYNGSYLNEEDKQDILDSIPETGLTGEVDAELQALGFSFGTFAIIFSGFEFSDLNVSKDAAELFLYGNQFGRNYDFRDSRADGSGFASVAVSKGFRLKMASMHEFAVGVTGRYIHGIANGRLRELSGSLTTDIDGLHGSGKLVFESSLGGDGFGLDFGVAARPTRAWTLSMSVANVYSNINWKTDAKRHEFGFTADSVTVQKIGEAGFDSVFVDSDSTYEIEGFSSHLPRQLRFGIARTGRNFTFAVNLTQGFEESVSSTKSPRVSVGAELRIIPLLPLRTGVALGGKRGLTTSAGFGLDFGLLVWDFALAVQDASFSGKEVSLAFSWMLRL